MDSSIFALNPSLNNDLGSSLKDFSNTIWRVGRPALPCPTLSSKLLLTYSCRHAGYAMARRIASKANILVQIMLWRGRHSLQNLTFPLTHGFFTLHSSLFT